LASLPEETRCGSACDETQEHLLFDGADPQQSLLHALVVRAHVLENRAQLRGRDHALGAHPLSDPAHGGHQRPIFEGRRVEVKSHA
jgi:hypothetical protein